MTTALSGDGTLATVLSLLMHHRVLRKLVAIGRSERQGCKARSHDLMSAYAIRRARHGCEQRVPAASTSRKAEGNLALIRSFMSSMSVPGVNLTLETGRALYREIT